MTTRPVRGVLARGFMRAEAAFDAAFGERANPLYHLGATSFFLFWVVTVSGLYLYAFFRTGVAEAYASVQAITEGQRWAGGIMRSAHRYASDGIVLTMFVHMLRHFAYGHFRGFRAFSWVTGVGLVWLVYVSGINGYMLPWDKLAQFVIVASFEFLDRLPIFGGVLIRNFIDASSVSDRFFSLLSFVHIGVPLFALLLMWVHVQRVPRARINPPRAVMGWILVTLLVVSLARPVQSQGGAADFGAEPASLALDWFYLAVYPLVYAWPLGRLWLLLGVATALLAALPWLGRRARRTGPGEFRMRVDPGGREAVVRAGETLLEAALRAGIAMPYECRNGACGKCRCRVVGGDVDAGAYHAVALPDDERARGVVLGCRATARSDVEIGIVDAPAAAAARTWRGRVTGMARLSPDVMRLTVAPQDGARPAFTAGQYVNVVLDDGQRRAFSFANPPHQAGDVELHVRLIPGGRFTTHVFTRMRVGDELALEGPLGSFRLNESARPIVFVAGATGFAPIKSIVEDAFHRRLHRPMLLYWGVRRPGDLYMQDLARQWEREHENFRFVAVVSEPAPGDGWNGRTGLVHEAILHDFPDLTGHEVYVCGSARMVDAAYPDFLAHGLPEEFCFSDAFRASS